MLHTFQLAAHIIVFVACLIGAIEVSRSYAALIHLRWRTRISAKVFFASVGVLNLLLALNEHTSAFFSVLVCLQAVALLVFLVSLFLDLMRALSRVRAAFRAIQLKHGHTGDEIIATVLTALQR